jgi:hypothetical protein
MPWGGAAFCIAIRSNTITFMEDVMLAVSDPVELQLLAGTQDSRYSGRYRH